MAFILALFLCNFVVIFILHFEDTELAWFYRLLSFGRFRYNENQFRNLLFGVGYHFVGDLIIKPPKSLLEVSICQSPCFKSDIASSFCHRSHIRRDNLVYWALFLLHLAKNYFSWLTFLNNLSWSFMKVLIEVNLVLSIFDCECVAGQIGFEGHYFIG